MKIQLNQIPQEGLNLKEEIDPSKLDLETELIRFRSPLSVSAQIHRITNAVTVKLNFKASMYSSCSRCLEEFDINLKKEVQLNYPVDKSILAIDLDPDIREEIILDYPIKPLCSPGCKGLCPKCGKNLNEGGCNCGST